MSAGANEYVPLLLDAEVPDALLAPLRRDGLYFAALPGAIVTSRLEEVS